MFRRFLSDLRRSSRSFGKHLRIFPWMHILLAAFLVGVAVIVLWLGRYPLKEEIPRAFGGALLAVGLVSILYDYFFVRRVIGRYFELLQTAASLELDRLYSDRSQALQDISAELEKASGKVKISCVSGSDFFGGGQAAKALSALVERRHNTQIRFLLLKPTSRYAKLRAWIEEKYRVCEEDQETLDVGNLVPKYSAVEFNESTMKTRLSTARASLLSLHRQLHPPTELSARFYGYQPSLFLVAVNRWIFVESYHWGVDRDYNPNPGQPCIAKRVLVLKFRRNSFNGMIFENHFDRLWRCARSKRFLPPPATAAVATSASIDEVSDQSSLTK